MQNTRRRHHRRSIYTHTLREGVGAPAWASGTDLWKDFTVPLGPLADPTDTHASTIYAPNAAGVYAPFAANVLTRTDLGLQTVPTRVELSAAPIPATATWIKTNVAITDNALLAPDGTTTAAYIARTSTAAAFCRPATITKAASPIQYTQAVIAKADTATFLAMRLQGLFPARADVCFNLALGTISLAATAVTFTGASASIAALGGGYYLCTLTATSDNHTSFSASVAARTSSGLIDDTDPSSTAGLYVWTNNVQAAAFAVPPILTGLATVNGNQQVIDLTGRLGTGVAGLLQVNFLTSDVSNFPDVMTISDGTANNLVEMFGGGGNLAFGLKAGGVDQGSLTVASWATGVRTIVFSVGPNFIQSRVVGQSAITADTVATWPTLNQLSLGSRGYVGTNFSYQRVSKLALKFEAQSQTTFDAMYALGLLT